MKEVLLPTQTDHKAASELAVMKRDLKDLSRVSNDQSKMIDSLNS